MTENEYTHVFTRKCPNDPTFHARYTLTITTTSTIMVEEIEAACAGDGSPVFHEKLADELVDRFGGYQQIEATHGETDIVTRRRRDP